MTTPQGLAVSAAHDAAQAHLLNTGLAEVTGIYTATITPTTLDSPEYPKLAAASVAKTRAKSVEVSKAFYGALRTAETGAAGLKVPFVVPTPGSPAAALLETSMLVTGPVAVKTALRNGASMQEALGTGLKRTIGAATRHVEGGARDANRLASFHDPLAHGWARRSGGIPCSFCAMLVSRGPVYSSAGTGSFKSHDFCHCKAVAFFGSDSGWTSQSSEYRDLWQAAKKNPDPNVTFASLYNARYPKTKKPSDVHAEAISQDSIHTTTLRAAAEAEALAAEKAAILAAEEAAAAAAAAAAEAEAIAAAEAKRVADEILEAAHVKALALKKKWEGKPAPVAPVLPPRPTGTLPKMRDQWLADVTARYDAIGTGKAFSSSYNYSYVLKAQAGDTSALDYLLAGKYVDDDLYQRAKALWKMPDVLDPADEIAYKSALRSFKVMTTRHSRYTEEWRSVNGVTTSPLKGLDGAREFTDTASALRWAKDNLYAHAPGPEREALRHYTGSGYRTWNAALRKTADRSTVPKGYETHTRNADAAMDRSVFPEDVIVLRGSQWDEFHFPGLSSRTQSIPPPDPSSLIGTVQTQHGYMSTSVGTHSAFGGTVNMKVRVPAGHKGSFVDPFSMNQGENEVFLERSTNLFIHDVYKNTNGRGGWVVECEVLPAGTSPADFAGHSPVKRSGSRL